MAFVETFYQVTLDYLAETKNERLWVKTNLKLAKLYLDRKEFNRLSSILKELRKTCEGDEGTDYQRKGTHLLEVLALEIQMYTETKNNKKLKVREERQWSWYCILKRHVARRNYINNVWVSNQLYHIRESWVSFENVVAKCICEKVRDHSKYGAVHGY